MNDKNTNEVKDLEIPHEQHSTLQSIALHILPGLLAGAVFWLLAYILSQKNIPPVLALYLTIIITVIPIEMGILWYQGYKKNNKITLHSVLHYTEKTPIWQVIILSLLALVWAAFIMAIVDEWLHISSWIQETLFGWLPSFFDISDIYLNPGSYSMGMKITVWILGLVFTSILGPFVEELYFRGYLLPKIDRFKYWAPFIHTILFAVYHFWSPWLIPIRIIAILPMNYLVYWKKDLKIGVVTHVLLNLIGDSILIFPIFFL